MPFNCDVCGDEVSYSERVFILRNKAEIVICSRCLRPKKALGHAGEGSKHPDMTDWDNPGVPMAYLEEVEKK